MARGKRAKKNTRPSIFKRFKEYFDKPGMFSKVLVIFCVAYCVRICEWAMWQFEMSNSEASTLLTAGLALFGGELLLLCLKRIFAKNDNKEAMDMCNDTNKMAD